VTQSEAPRPSSDPFSGFLDWYARSAFQCAVDLSVCWLRLVESAGPRVEVPVEEGGPAAVTVPVLATVTDRPILLATEGFRAVGWGDEYALPADAITLTPRELSEGDVEFEITVSTKALPAEARARTIVYEARVVDRSGADVCDVVHFVKSAE
jgi:hypothetical protein